MSLRRPAKEQPEKFEFNSSSLEAANSIVSKYPKGKQQSAVMALLYIAQKQNDNWIPLVAMKYIAKFLDMPYIKVYEVATFYSMYNLAPVGKYFVQVCTTTPCMIRGANHLVEACKEKISENEAELSNNKICSWMEVECLGACVNAPMMQINDDYYEDLDKKKTLEILNKILKDEKPKPGSYRGRINNQPENNRKTLMDLKNA
jgi:NADH-quinone oxidoreductase E subunit